MRQIKVHLKHFKYFEAYLCLSRSPGTSALPSLLLAQLSGFSSRVSFQLAGPHWVQFQQTENLFTFGGKIRLFKYALQVFSSQLNISTHVNRTNCQLNFDVIPLDVVDYAQIQSWVVPVYPTTQVSLQLDVYLNPTGKSQVLPVYTSPMWFREFTSERRLQVLVGVCCCAQKIRC